MEGSSTWKGPVERGGRGWKEAARGRGLCTRADPSIFWVPPRTPRGQHAAASLARTIHRLDLVLVGLDRHLVEHVVLVKVDCAPRGGGRRVRGGAASRPISAARFTPREIRSHPAPSQGTRPRSAPSPSPSPWPWARPRASKRCASIDGVCGARRSMARAEAGEGGGAGWRGAVRGGAVRGGVARGGVAQCPEVFQRSKEAMCGV